MFIPHKKPVSVGSKFHSNLHFKGVKNTWTVAQRFMLDLGNTHTVIQPLISRLTYFPSTIPKALPEKYHSHHRCFELDMLFISELCSCKCKRDVTSLGDAAVLAWWIGYCLSHVQTVAVTSFTRYKASAAGSSRWAQPFSKQQWRMVLSVVCLIPSFLGPTFGRTQIMYRYNLAVLN